MITFDIVLDMKPKRILGLDLGTSSIGWALVDEAEVGEKSSVVKLGVRIIQYDTFRLTCKVPCLSYPKIL